MNVKTHRREATLFGFSLKMLKCVFVSEASSRCQRSPFIVTARCRSIGWLVGRSRLLTRHSSGRAVWAPVFHIRCRKSSRNSLSSTHSYIIIIVSVYACDTHIFTQTFSDWIKSKMLFVVHHGIYLLKSHPSTVAHIDTHTLHVCLSQRKSRLISIFHCVCVCSCEFVCLM